MAADVLITCLPDEVIELILLNECLTIQDVVHVALSCKRLYKSVFTNNKIWRTKFLERWPALKETYLLEGQLNKVKNWIHEVQSSISSRKELMYHLSHMSENNHKREELSHVEFKDFDPIFRPEMGAHPMAYHFLVDELISFINVPVQKGNLTHKYYAYKVIRYLRETYLHGEWDKFMLLSPKEQILEKGATLVSQWSQPERRVSYVQISKKLDDIAEQIKDLLREENPSHPIFSTDPEQLENWKKYNFDDNQWSGTDSKQILSVLCDVIFNKLRFHGSNETYYSSKNSFIDRVLETRRGIPITLSIIFDSVCRRVGIRCELISFPAHFLLQWKERYTGPNVNDYECLYIDIFKGGEFLTRSSCPLVGRERRCPIDRYNKYHGSSAIDVMERMANNLEVAGRQRIHLNGRESRLLSALQLLNLLKPNNVSNIQNLARFYVQHQMNLDKLFQILTFLKKGPEISSRGPADYILHNLQEYQRSMNTALEETEIKIRTPNVKYCIGMIMRHRRHTYLCVIVGWDLECKGSSQWRNGMGADELSGGADQPFYDVFTNDGSSRYAAQESLIVDPQPQWVNHYEVGRYFCEFRGNHYVPNEERAKEYPEDAAIQNELLARYFQ